MARILSAVVLFLAIQPAARAAEDFFLRDGQRVVFLGDSNTFAGLFIAYIDGYLATRFPDRKFELINLGLPSETVSGLSEPDHPYPRPDVHERLERALAKTRPDVVVACYGMNDGIYYAFDEERFRKYQQGMQRLIERAQKAGAKIVLMTPAPFDPQPLKAKLLPASAEKFSWLRPYEGYDDVLTCYADWLVTLREKGFLVIDAHRAINQHLAAVRRSDPAYIISGDGIHPNATGHALIAREVLQAWNAPAEVDRAEIHVKTLKAKHGDVSDLSVENGVISFRWRTRLPMPADPKWDKRLEEREQLYARLNRQCLTIRGTEQVRYVLSEDGRKIAELSGEQLAAGVDLSRFKELSPYPQSAELWKLVEERQRLLGLAWLTDVGHKRPDTPKGLALDEAQRRAGAFEIEIRKRAQPVQITLHFSPAAK